MKGRRTALPSTLFIVATAWFSACVPPRPSKTVSPPPPSGRPPKIEAVRTIMLPFVLGGALWPEQPKGGGKYIDDYYSGEIFSAIKSNSRRRFKPFDQVVDALREKGYRTYERRDLGSLSLKSPLLDAGRRGEDILLGDALEIASILGATQLLTGVVSIQAGPETTPACVVAMKILDGGGKVLWTVTVTKELQPYVPIKNQIMSAAAEAFRSAP